MMPTHPLSDGCPNCVSTYNRPVRYRIQGNSYLAQYRCSRCLWSWTCGWLLTAFDSSDKTTLQREAGGRRGH